MAYRLTLALIMGLVAVAALAFALAPNPRAVVLSSGLMVALGITLASPKPRNRLLIGWTVVFGLNLIVPLIFAAEVTKKAGALGMNLAIFLLLGLGFPAVSRFRWMGRAVVLGGCIVAASQLYPVAQMFAGITGIAAARVAGQTAGDFEIISEFGGFIATVVTGGILIAAALLLGTIMRVMWVGFGRLRAVRKSNANLGAAGSPKSLTVRLHWGLAE